MDENNKVDETIEEEILEEEMENLEDSTEEVESEEVVEEVKSEESAEDGKLKDAFMRLQADFANYKRRTENEKKDIYKFSTEKLVTKLLGVLDNFDRAFGEVQEDDKEDPFTKGVELIQKEMYSILENEGLELVESDGKMFDANLHHAVFMEENDQVESEHIIETFQKGYKLNGKVIRPAMVKVSK